MKYLLLLLTLITAKAGAQTFYPLDLSQIKGKVWKPIPSDTVWVPIGLERSKTDTVKAIFLVSDTAYFYNSNIAIGLDSFVLKYRCYLYMEIGYAVREYHSHWKWDCVNCPDYWSTTEYLNIFKKPFISKIIWQAKLLN